MVSEDAVVRKLCDLTNDVKTLEAYAKMKYAHFDRHGVVDAMMDIRDLESMCDALKWVLGRKSSVP